MREMKKSNKGFSMVELIIVIAIMAILVGIVGANIIPYLEKSKKSKDEQILNMWCTNARSAYSMNAMLLDPSETYFITVTDSDIQVTGGNQQAQEAIEEMFVELDPSNLSNGYPFSNFESKAGRNIDEVVIACCDPAEQPEGGYEHCITLSVVMDSGSRYSFDTMVSN